MLVDSWCAETSFPKKTIPSICFGEYKCCYMICNSQIHILMIIFYAETFHVLQNQSFSSLLLWVMLFLVTATYSFRNYVLKMVIKFPFLCGFFALDFQICVN